MSTPDFDNMSPEELMAWMESLARRQGADEGFTSDVVMDVPEVDPNSIQDTGPGYIPYGMSAEQWEEKQRKDEEKKAQRRAAQGAPQAAMPPTPAAPTPPSAPEPEPIPTPAAPPPQPAAASGGAPDFDSMSPEELMAWMESLARRQGADEGFTSDVVMDVPEVDPSTIQDTGPGYIPYGMSAEQWEEKQRKDEEKKAQRRAAQGAAPTPSPVAPTPPPTPEPTFELPTFPDAIADDSTQAAPAAEDNPLAWLENLGSSQNAVPELDLSSLGAPLEAPSGLPADDPMSWLESLSQEQSSIPALEQFADTPADNSLEWLESLARRQGADSEELTTGANLDVPVPDNIPASSTPGYTEYSFEAGAGDNPLDFLENVADDDFEPEFDTEELNDSSDWLSKLAKGQPDDVEDLDSIPDTAEIMDKLSKNEVNPNEIESWMANLLEQGAARNDVPDYIDDEDEEQPVEAELPDWLKEQIGTPPAAVSGSNAPALDDRVVEPPAPPMPDWLTEDIDAEATLDFDSIFETETPVVPAVASPETPSLHISTEEIQIDAADDPWVEAFELERTMGLDDISQIPDWYAAKLEQVSPTLSPAELPEEEELSAGELQTLPDWLNDAITPAADAAAEVEAAVATPVSDMPDWLRASVSTPQEAEAVELPDWLSVAGVNMEEVPDWLKDTIKTDEAPMVQPEAPAPQVVAAPKAPASPAIIPTAAAAIDVNETLTNARAEVKSRNLDNALQHYEAVVRANTALDSVVTDLTGLINDEFHKKNPAIYRVLGDGLMRQGKLQEALDTYRKALNLL